MKIRIKGNSLRFRVTRSEVERLLKTGRIEETMWLGSEDSSRLTFALEHSGSVCAATLRSFHPEIAIVLPPQDVRDWSSSDEVGVYAMVSLGPRGFLDVAIEKDFACLDRSDEDNLDTFPHPLSEARC